MKKVLLPTDLTVQSLRPVHNIVNDANGQEIAIHVVHVISLPSSITDLLFINQNKPYHAIPAKFSEAFQLLRNKYDCVVKNFSFEFIYCNSSRYLNNFIEGNNIDSVYMLKDYNYIKPLKQSENFIPYFNKCMVPLVKVAVDSEYSADYQNLSALLNGNEKLKITQSARNEKTSISYS